MNAPVILQKLIQFPSVTPDDAGCFDYLEKILKNLGFEIYRKVFKEANSKNVENFYARIGKTGPHLLFAGHVDVVPSNEELLWRHPPFSGKQENGILYGRGAVDMKGGIACFIAALQHYLLSKPENISISLALTADEEGPAVNGTVKLLQWLKEKGECWDAALVGEPTCLEKLGDCIKIGRRGSLSGVLEVIGQQGHVAYPDKAANPLALLNFIIQHFIETKLDEGNKKFQSSNLEFTSIDTGNSAGNVIPQSAKAAFNIRYNDFWNAQTLKEHIHSLSMEAFNAYTKTNNKPYKFTLDWQQQPAEAFLTKNESLVKSLEKAIIQSTKIQPQLSTGGGTSDARFIKSYCPVIEFGLVGKTMHKIDECVKIEDLYMLTNIYANFLKIFFEDASKTL